MSISPEVREAFTLGGMLKLLTSILSNQNQIGMRYFVQQTEYLLTGLIVACLFQALLNAWLGETHFTQESPWVFLGICIVVYALLNRRGR